MTIEGDQPESKYKTAEGRTHRTQRTEHSHTQTAPETPSLDFLAPVPVSSVCHSSLTELDIVT